MKNKITREEAAEMLLQYMDESVAEKDFETFTVRSFDVTIAEKSVVVAVIHAGVWNIVEEIFREAGYEYYSRQRVQ